MNDRDCDNCAHHSDGGCSVWECSFEQKDDTISRQTAIDAIRREYNKEDSDLPTEYQLGLSAGRRIIDGLPSAQFIEPERKTGKWIEQDDGWDGVYYECSVCKEAFTLIDGNPSDNLYNFCPNCGADMRGGQK